MPRPEGTDLFGKLGMGWLEKLKLPQADRKRLDQLVRLYEFIHKEIGKSDAAVCKIVRSDERCQWLKTVPGIGDFFAALIMAEVDHVERFRDAKHFVSYMGLVPRRDKSGQVDRKGRMHKQGSKWLRWALVEAAIPATKTNLALKNHYDRICRRKGEDDGPKLAKVAVANKLAWIVYRLLVEKRPYEER